MTVQGRDVAGLVVAFVMLGSVAFGAIGLGVGLVMLTVAQAIGVGLLAFGLGIVLSPWVIGRPIARAAAAAVREDQAGVDPD